MEKKGGRKPERRRVEAYEEGMEEIEKTERRQDGG